MEEYFYLFILFIMYSVLGWITETTEVFITKGKIVNRGFLIGPYCPIYGVGLILITSLLKNYTNNVIVLFVLSACICMILEYLTSYIMEKFFHARWWDYSDCKLYLKGVKVYTHGIDNNIHSSGHANQEELKLMIRLFNPQYFAPYHGEYRMLKTHCDIANMCNIPKQNTFILSNGDILNITKEGIKKQGHVTASDVYVDGSRIGDVSNVVIKDRKLMSNNGVLAIIFNIDSKNKKILNNPLVTTRGYILVNESHEVIKEIEDYAKRIIIQKLKEKVYNYNDVKNEIVNKLMPFCEERIGRVPIILPMILDIKKK